MQAKLITFMKLNIPEDFLVISVLVTCSSLVSTWSRLVPAQKPTPIAQPWRSKSVTFLQTNQFGKKNQNYFCEIKETLALTRGQILIQVSFSYVQKHFLGYFFLYSLWSIQTSSCRQN